MTDTLPCQSLLIASSIDYERTPVKYDVTTTGQCTGEILQYSLSNLIEYELHIWDYFGLCVFLMYPWIFREFAHRFSKETQLLTELLIKI